MKIRLPFVLVVMTAAALLFSGCSDGVKEKEAVQQAIRKQAEIQHYRFSGSGSFGWESQASSPISNPLTAGLANAVNGAALEWSGAASYNPVRLETVVKVTTRSGNPFQIPFLIKDNKMYAQFPLLNKKDEYFSFDLTKPAGGSASGPLSPEALTRSHETVSRMLDALLSGVEPKWFKEDKIEDGGSGEQYSIKITESNAAELSKQFQTALAEWNGQLDGGGLLGLPGGNSGNQQSKLSDMQLQAPGSIRIRVNPDLFIENIYLDLTVRPSASASSTAQGPYRLKLDYSLSDINKPPAFEQIVPANVKPFEDLLKLLPKQ